MTVILVWNEAADDNPRDSFAAQALADNLLRAIGILRKVIDQTERRVVRGEKVPASEKIVSSFEDHTDIIVKGQRDTQFGHKVFLTGGASNLILDCLIERGNPATVIVIRICSNGTWSSLAEHHAR